MSRGSKVGGTKRRVLDVVGFTAIIVLFLLYMVPFILVLLNSFKQKRDIIKNPFSFITEKGYTLANYTKAFEKMEFIKAFGNSLFITGLSTLLVIIFASMVAYYFTRAKNTFSRVFFALMAASMIIPFQAIMIPLVSIYGSGLHMLNHRLTLIFMHTGFAMSMSVFIYQGFIKSGIPLSLEEAAYLDGCTNVQTFFKVVFPDLLPGVMSGFLMAFTMSLDDFIITHFTKGPGVDTLSTKIYTEVKKGIKPEMYALSTLLFLSVMVIMILMNTSPKETDSKKAGSTSKDFKRKRKIPWHQVIPAGFILLIAVTGLVHHVRTTGSISEEQVIVYNWGEYIDPDVLDIFEEETGIQVIYEEYETNEIMYPKILSGAIAYDVVCPSDYMIQRMRENGLLSKLNLDNIPNLKNIDPAYLTQSQSFDPDNEYSVPYCVGTVGILYNKNMIDEPVDSWNIRIVS